MGRKDTLFVTVYRTSVYLWNKKETAVSRQVSDKDTPKAPSRGQSVGHQGNGKRELVNEVISQ